MEIFSCGGGEGGVWGVGGRFTEKTRSARARNYHEQYEHGDDRYGQVHEHGGPPLFDDGRGGREHGGAEKIENRGRRHERAPQLGLAHFADVRGKRAARETDAQAHQRRARVHAAHVFRVNHDELRHYERHVRQYHTVFVAQPLQRQRGQHAAHGRAQIHQTPCVHIIRMT